MTWAAAMPGATVSDASSGRCGIFISVTAKISCLWFAAFCPCLPHLPTPDTIFSPFFFLPAHTLVLTLSFLLPFNAQVAVVIPAMRTLQWLALHPRLRHTTVHRLYWLVLALCMVSPPAGPEGMLWRQAMRVSVAAQGGFCYWVA